MYIHLHNVLLLLCLASILRNAFAFYRHNLHMNSSVSWPANKRHVESCWHVMFSNRHRTIADSDTLGCSLVYREVMAVVVTYYVLQHHLLVIDIGLHVMISNWDSSRIERSLAFIRQAIRGTLTCPTAVLTELRSTLPSTSSPLSDPGLFLPPESESCE